MSSHIGISCDSCLKTNFPNRRYKCLICDNYDLCGSCYDINTESHNHLNIHPMQCILTKTAYELFYSGESIPHRTIVSLTCPYCCAFGFIPHTLLTHCLENHLDNKTSQMCPICVINPIQGNQIRFISLADHIAKEHDNGDLSITQKEDFDQDEDEDEGLPLYILAERLFIKEENRRQRLAQTLVRNDFNSHRRLLSRQTATRGSRGSMRGHPYGTVPRTTTGSFRIPFDTSISSDPYAAILFSQDPLFDYDSSFPDSITQAPFFLTSSLPTHIPSLEPVTNDQIIQKKSNFSNPKQKRSNHVQQPSTQPVLLIEPSISDHQLWQQNVSSLNNNINFDKPIENKNENDSRSLLGKILKIDQNNKSTSKQDHTAFLQSLFFSSLNISINKEQLS